MTYERRSIEHLVRDADLMLSSPEDWATEEESLSTRLLSELVAVQSAQASATLALVQAVQDLTEKLESGLDRIWMESPS